MRQLITNDDETITVEITSVNEPGPGEDDDPMFPRFLRAHCRACPWDSFVDDGAMLITEGDAINAADDHLDRHADGLTADPTPPPPVDVVARPTSLTDTAGLYAMYQQARRAFGEARDLVALSVPCADHQAAASEDCQLGERVCGPRALTALMTARGMA